MRKGLGLLCKGGAANPGCRRLSAGDGRHEDSARPPKSRLKGGCGHDCPPHVRSTAAIALIFALAVPTFAQRGGGAKGPPPNAKPAVPAEPTPRWPDGHVNLGS